MSATLKSPKPAQQSARSKPAKKLAFTVADCPPDCPCVKDGKFTAIPKEWSSVKHKPIPESAFVDEATFCNIMAERCDEKAKRYRQRAEDSKLLGNVIDKKAAKRRLNMLSKIDTAIAEMMGEGKEELLRLRGFGAQVDAFKAKQGV